MSALWSSRVGLTTVALAASGSTTLLFNVVLARRLSVAGFGEVARTYSIALAVAQITMAAVAPAARVRGLTQTGRFDEARELRREANAALKALPVAAFPAVAPAALARPDEPEAMKRLRLTWATLRGRI